MHKLLIMLLVSALSGCVGPRGALNPLPKVVSPTDTAEIFILRNNNFAGSAVNYRVTLDGLEILGIGIGEHTSFQVDSGQHAIGVICNGGWAPGDHFNEKRVYMEPGSVHYFMARAGGVCAVIEVINEQVAKKYIKSDKFIELSATQNAPE
ncbi:hypothetical protein R50072_33620 [Simiduia litorea]|uniref:hypothetical protein n=1 Tax=Simiduia litorea TaxID=1435348 RepID=UPI0036F37A58